MSKKLIFSIATTLFAFASAQAAPVKKPVVMPPECLTNVQNMTAASDTSMAQPEAADVGVSNVKVTKIGEIPPSDYHGPIEYSANLTIYGDVAGTVKVRLVRGGCMVTRFIRP